MKAVRKRIFLPPCANIAQCEQEEWQQQTKPVLMFIQTFVQSQEIRQHVTRPASAKETQIKKNVLK